MITLLMIAHFVGLIMGFSATFANMVVMRLIASATPQEAEVLRRVPAPMMRISAWGLGLMVVSGIWLVYAKHDGAWGTLSLAFWFKMLAVLSLIVLYGLLHANMARARRGDAVAGPRIPMLAPLANIAAAVALLLAVIAFA